MPYNVPSHTRGIRNKVQGRGKVVSSRKGQVSIFKKFCEEQLNYSTTIKMMIRNSEEDGTHDEEIDQLMEIY